MSQDAPAAPARPSELLPPISLAAGSHVPRRAWAWSQEKNKNIFFPNLEIEIQAEAALAYEKEARQRGQILNQL
jgi:hypothetical protein